MGTGVHPRGYSGQGVKLATHFQLVLILILLGFTPRLLLCACMCCCNWREQIGIRSFFSVAECSVQCDLPKV